MKFVSNFGTFYRPRKIPYKLKIFNLIWDVFILLSKFIILLSKSGISSIFYKFVALKHKPKSNQTLT
jgi:hypothetical protein